MSIRHRITLLIALSFIAIFSIGGYSIYQARANAAEVKRVTESVVPSTLATVELVSLVKEVQFITKSLISEPDNHLAAQAKEKLAVGKTKLQESINFQFEYATDNIQKGLVQQAKDNLTEYFGAIDESVQSRLGGNAAFSEANYYANVVILQRELQQIVETLRVEKTRSKESTISALNKNLSNTVTGVSVVSLVTIIILTSFGIILYRQIISPISQMQQMTSEIATTQNFSHQIPVQRMDEIGLSIVAFNLMIDKIRENSAMVQERTAELQEANRRLQKLDQLKSDFLSSVSHELRTPLTSIRGFAHLVEREFSRSFASEDNGLVKKSNRIQENLAIILKESDRLTRLINDVLDLAKIEAGKIEWCDVPLQAGALVRDAVNSAHSMFVLKPGVELKVEIEDGLPSFIGDADRMLQVLVNLLNNAAKFTDQGTVTVKAFLNPESLIQIDISDSGIGFPAEEAEAIFDKFQQSSQGDTLTDRPKGTGLGLAISREIVERHGGVIRAQSQPGMGSVFTVTLQPASEALAKTTEITSRIESFAAEKPQTGETPPSDKGGKPRVLVVDDDEGVRDYLTQLLQEQDYEVISAADGQAAVVAAETYRPDLITMDLAMPVMDGRTAIALLRADPALQHIPIMVVSALPGWDIAGGDLAMGKPLDEPRFLKNIHSLLGIGESAEAKKVHFLILYEAERNSAMAPGGFTAQCKMDYCPVDELSARIQSGFQGMVVVPTDLLDKVDLRMLNAAPSLEVMIMPVQMAARDGKNCVGYSRVGYGLENWRIS